MADIRSSVLTQTNNNSYNPYISKWNTLFDNGAQWIAFKPQQGLKVYPCFACKDMFSCRSSFIDHVNRRAMQLLWRCRACRDSTTARASSTLRKQLSGEAPIIFYNSCALLLHIRDHITSVPCVVNNGAVISEVIDLDDLISSTSLPPAMYGFLPHPNIPILYNFPETDCELMLELAENGEDVSSLTQTQQLLGTSQERNNLINTKFYSPQPESEGKRFIPMIASFLTFAMNNSQTKNDNAMAESRLILRQVSKKIPLCIFVECPVSILIEQLSLNSHISNTSKRIRKRVNTHNDNTNNKNQENHLTDGGETRVPIIRRPTIDSVASSEGTSSSLIIDIKEEPIDTDLNASPLKRLNSSAFSTANDIDYDSTIDAHSIKLEDRYEDSTPLVQQVQQNHAVFDRGVTECVEDILQTASIQLRTPPPLFNSGTQVRRNAPVTKENIYVTPNKKRKKIKKAVSSNALLARLCPECNTLFSYATSYPSDLTPLEQHLKGPGGIDRPYNDAWKCMYCAYVAASRCSLRAHSRLHNAVAPFVCPECGTLFSTYNMLLMHNETSCFHMAKQVRFRCPRRQCSKIFATSTTFGAHVKIHMKLAHKCRLCEQLFDTPSGYVEHFEENRCRSEEETRNMDSTMLMSENFYTCTVCNDSILGSDDNSEDPVSSSRCIISDPRNKSKWVRIEPHNQPEYSEHINSHATDPKLRVYVYNCRHCRNAKRKNCFRCFRSSVTFAQHLSKCMEENDNTKNAKMNGLQWNGNDIEQPDTFNNNTGVRKPKSYSNIRMMTDLTDPTHSYNSVQMENEISTNLCDDTALIRFSNLNQNSLPINATDSISNKFNETACDTNPSDKGTNCDTEYNDKLIKLEEVGSPHRDINGYENHIRGVHENEDQNSIHVSGLDDSCILISENDLNQQGISLNRNGRHNREDETESGNKPTRLSLRQRFKRNYSVSLDDTFTSSSHIKRKKNYVQRNRDTVTHCPLCGRFVSKSKLHWHLASMRKCNETRLQTHGEKILRCTFCNDEFQMAKIRSHILLSESCGKYKLHEKFKHLADNDLLKKREILCSESDSQTLSTENSSKENSPEKSKSLSDLSLIVDTFTNDGHKKYNIQNSTKPHVPVGQQLLNLDVLQEKTADDDDFIREPSKFDGVYRCASCTLETRERSDFGEHIRTLHRTVSTAYQCMECGECFVVLPSLAKHLTYFHEVYDLDTYLATNDCYDKEAVAELEKNLFLNNTNERVPNGNSKPLSVNQCRICRLQCEDTTSYEKHLRTHGMAFLMNNSK